MQRNQLLSKMVLLLFSLSRPLFRNTYLIDSICTDFNNKPIKDSLYIQLTCALFKCSRKICPTMPNRRLTYSSNHFQQAMSVLIFLKYEMRTIFTLLSWPLKLIERHTWASLKLKNTQHFKDGISFKETLMTIVCYVSFFFFLYGILTLLSKKIFTL